MTDKLLNGAAGAVPDYMQGVGSEQEFGGGMDGGSFPRLAFKGNRFRLRQGDDEIVLPDNSLETIILKDYPHISRIYFDTRYSGSGENERPSCASADGEFPLSNIAVPQNNNCALCPQNQKGSVITDDGRKSRACGFFKRIVLTIKGYEDVGPIVCDVKSMSLFGDSKPNDNLWTLKAYFARLKANNTQPFQLVTKISFDVDSSVPVVLFEPLGYVDADTFESLVTPLVNTPDGLAQLELLTDTNTIRVEDEDNRTTAKPGTGPLLPESKPAHLESPEVSLQAQLDDAIADGDFLLAAKLQEKILAADPGTEEPSEEPAPLSQQEIIDGLRLDLKLAVEAADFDSASIVQAKLKEAIAAAQGASQDSLDLPNTKKAADGDTDPDVNAHGERWNPDVHATSSKTGRGIQNADGHWRVRRGIKPAEAEAITAEATQAAAEGSMAEGEEEEAPAEATGFSSELDEALKDYGFAE